MNVKYDIVTPVLLCIAFRYTPYHSPKRYILLSDIAHFVVRNSQFQGAIWCFSASETGHFASRNGAFCKAEKYPLNTSY